MTASIAVVDRNVAVIALLTAQQDAPTARILDGLLTGRFAFLRSSGRVPGLLMRTRIRKRHGLTEHEVDAILTDIAANGQIRDVEGGLLGRGDGDEYLHALSSARADVVLVTGDASLRNRLSRGRALSPKAFVDLLES